MDQERVYIQDIDLKSSPISNMENCNVSVIDGDGFGYIVGWSFNQHFSVTPELVSEVNKRVDSFISTILTDTKADYFIGILEAEIDWSVPDEEYKPVSNFRHKYAVTKTYKGKRPEKPEWYKLWGPVIQDRLVKHWNFQRVSPEVEADDLVASLATGLRTFKKINVTLCGNDKDLHQVPGVYLNYKTNESWMITEQDAVRSLYSQVLQGDATDNIPGLAGVGKKTAAEVVMNPKFNEKSGYMYTLQKFVLKLGEDKGIQSFFENYMLCKLRTDLPIYSYSLIKYNPVASETMIAMRELLGDREMDSIIKDHSLGERDFNAGADLFGSPSK